MGCSWDVAVYAHPLLARVPANSSRLPALRYLHTSVAGAFTCQLNPRACAPLFTHISCRRACVQTQRTRLRQLIYSYPLQARALANSRRVPAPHYLPRALAATLLTCLRVSSSQTLKQFLYTKEGPLRDTGLPTSTRYSRNAADTTSSPVFANPRATLIYKRTSV